MRWVVPFRRRRPPSPGGSGEPGAGPRSVLAYVYLTLALVVISLLSLSAVPLLLYEKSSCPVVTLGEPTGAVISEIEGLIALESFATSSFLLTGDAAERETIRWLRERRRIALRALTDVAEFGPEFTAEAHRLTDYFAGMDQRLDAVYEGRLARDEFVRHTKQQKGAYTFVTESTAALRDDIAAHIAEHRRATRVAERRASALSLLSTMLAIVAVVAVARLGQRYRHAAAREHAARARSDEAYAEAERQRQEIERISASRAVLVRGFSHDLGNPLVAADWHLRLVEASERQLPPAEGEAISSARQAVRTAIQMIADLLDLAHAEAGQIRIQRVPTDIGAVVSGVVQEFKAAAEGKGLVLRKAIEPDVSVIESDPERVRQILGNLVANAIKYTVAGEVAVSVKPGTTPNGVVVEVSDTGPGLDEEQQQNVFTEFYRATMPGAPPGAGIGLAISQRLAVALSGRLSVTSAPGRGATFVLELPLGQAAAV